MRKIIPLLLLPMLVACGAPSQEETVDRSELRVQCEKESGFSGDAQLVPETKTVFVWRADGEEVAECQDGVFLGVLDSGQHPADAL